MKQAIASKLTLTERLPFSHRLLAKINKPFAIDIAIYLTTSHNPYFKALF